MNNTTKESIISLIEDLKYDLTSDKQELIHWYNLKQYSTQKNKDGINANIKCLNNDIDCLTCTIERLEDILQCIK